VEAGGALENGLTPEALAHYTVSIVDGIVLHHTLSRDDAAAERNLALVRQNVLQLMNVPVVSTNGKMDRL